MVDLRTRYALALGLPLAALRAHAGDACEAAWVCGTARPGAEPGEYRPMPERHNRGRPVRVDGASVLPEVASNGEDLIAGLSVGRDEVGAAWVEEARMEYAAVAAFSRLALQLIALGAPTELVSWAHEAAIEEMTHAEGAFAIAESHGARRSPAPFPAAIAPIAPEVATLARETLLDGCVGEAVAAEEARWAAELAIDEEIADHLRAVAEEEGRHAELSWRILGWLRETHPTEVDPVVREVRGRLMAERQVEATLESPCCPRRTRRHGVLCPHERALLRGELLDAIILPILGAVG